MTSGARGIAELEVSEDFSIGFRNGIDLIVPQDSNAMAGLGNVPVDILCVLADNIMNKTDLLSLRLVSCRFDDHLMPCIYRRLVREVLSKIGTHLHRAATICYDLAIQRLLSAEISVDCRDDSGETALHVAARNNCLVSVRRLLSAGAKVDARSYHQWTPLQLAARYGHVSILRELIGAGADINLRGFHGWTALYYGARSGDLDVTEVLLSAGAEAHSLDNDRRTAAQEAITYGHQEVLGMLEKFAGGQESSG